MTNPKDVSDFAKEYQNTYLANVQMASTIKYLREKEAKMNAASVGKEQVEFGYEKAYR